MFYIKGMKKITLRNGETALVDDDDFERLRSFKWYLSHGYAVSARHRKGKSRKDLDRTENFAMHRLVMGNPPTEGLMVDHIDRDRLNNQKNNLRWVSYHQNSHNSKNPCSEYKGVSKDGSKWIAQIKSKRLGSFDTKKEAALAYDKAARKLFGEYAYQNFPMEHFEGAAIRHLDYTPEAHIPVSKFAGVTYFGHGGKRVKRWRAVFRKKTLGYFLTEEEAKIKYELAKEQYESSKSQN